MIIETTLGRTEWQVRKSAACRWIGICPTLNLTMEGDSVDDLVQNIHESVHLLADSLSESGELDAYLHHHGPGTKRETRQALKTA